MTTPHHFSTSRRGFTLIELLAVISIIVIVSAAFGFAVLGQGGDSQKATTASQLISSSLQGVRGQALLRGTKARLIIHADDSSADIGKYLRFIGVIYADPDDPNPEDPTRWIAANEGTFLPAGAYFNDEVSSRGNGSMAAPQTMRLEFPRLSPKTEGSGELFYYYEFELNGTVLNNSGARIVTSTGERTASGLTLHDPLGDDTEDPGQHAGFILLRIGSSIPYPDSTVVAEAVETNPPS